MKGGVVDCVLLAIQCNFQGDREGIGKSRWRQTRNGLSRFNIHDTTCSFVFWCPISAAHFASLDQVLASDDNFSAAAKTAVIWSNRVHGWHEIILKLPCCCGVLLSVEGNRNCCSTCTMAVSWGNTSNAVVTPNISRNRDAWKVEVTSDDVGFDKIGAGERYCSDTSYRSGRRILCFDQHRCSVIHERGCCMRVLLTIQCQINRNHVRLR